MTLTTEQSHTLHEAAAYRYPRFGIHLSPRFSLEVSATAINPNRRIFGPYILGIGSYQEMRALRKAAMAEYKSLTEREHYEH